MRSEGLSVSPVTDQSVIDSHDEKLQGSRNAYLVKGDRPLSQLNPLTSRLARVVVVFIVVIEQPCRSRTIADTGERRWTAEQPGAWITLDRSAEYAALGWGSERGEVGEGFAGRR